ncbi:hypothetical protein M6B38_138600 [Iris pallida]|uniref:Uncharacterized protein n=1 Tax=Iris pallida TaxID=29817 RepID=A0AAX6FET7_IRIPA|nr:hypothetical protein M6B38_138600 [Iris pallida]
MRMNTCCALSRMFFCIMEREVVQPPMLARHNIIEYMNSQDFAPEIMILCLISRSLTFRF